MNKPRIAKNLADYLADTQSVLPKPVDPQQSAEQTITLYRQSVVNFEAGFSQTAGATFNLYFGDFSGQPYYAIALYSDLVPEPEPGKEADVRVLRSLIEQNLELLLDPRNNIGLWYDDESDLLYLDISAAVPDKNEAISLGEHYNEKEGFDLERGEPFSIGGTGTPLENLLPPSMRLTSLVRQDVNSAGTEL